MKKILIASLLLALMTLTTRFSASAQAITFAVDFAGGANGSPFLGGDQGNEWEVIQDSAGSYYTVGRTPNDTSGWTDVYLCKIDSTGNLLWERPYNGPQFGTRAASGRGIVLSKDGYLIVTGCINCGAYPPNDSQNLLMKIDPSTGDTVWVRTYGGPQREWANSVCLAADGGYVMAGRTNSWGQGSADMWFVKTDTAGNMVWDTTFDVQGEAWAFSIAPANDGGFIACGTMCAGLCLNTTLVKLDSTGNIQWYQQYPGIGNSSFGESVKQTFDNGYILSGWANDDAFIIKTDSLGNSQWERSFTMGADTIFEIGHSVIQTADSNYVLVKYTGIENINNGYITELLAFIKLDSAGNTIWEKEFLQDTVGGAMFLAGFYPGYFFWSGHDIRQTHDGGFIIATELGGFIKTDAELNILYQVDFHEANSCDSINKIYFSPSILSAGTTVLWDFGDGDTSTIYNPVHAYAATGVYTVTLIASNILGSDTAVHTVNFVAANAATCSITSPVNPVAVNTPITIIGNCQNGNFNFWDFGDGTDQFTNYDSSGYCYANYADTVYHIYMDTGTFIVMLLTWGCCGNDDDIEDTSYYTITVVDSITAVAENMTIETGAFVYPNPAGDNIHIKSSAGFNDAEFRLSDATGRIVLRRKIKSKEAIAVSQLQSGIYLYEMNDRNGITVRGKLIKE